ncbi:MAG TPA: hypothetical protein VGM88_32515 [Kofleriaceae bacterium]|jgi:hypothetical protein
MKRNVISVQEDVWLDEIRGIVTDFGQGDRETLAAVIAEVASRKLENVTLDLIGHATNLDPRQLHSGPGTCSFLTLGPWVIDDSPETAAIFASLHDEMVAAGIVSLRLLGCSTAATVRGWKAICNIGAALPGIDVIGTKRVLFANDFAADGCTIDLMMLQSSSEDDYEPGGRTTGEIPRVEPPFDASQLAAQAPGPSPDWPTRQLDVVAGRKLWTLLDAAPSTPPPALARPIVELYVPAAADGTFHRVQVLCDWELVRVFPTDVPSGACFHVDEPQQLHAMLSA